MLLIAKLHISFSTGSKCILDLLGTKLCIVIPTKLQTHFHFGIKISNTSISFPIKNGSTRNLIAIKTFTANFRRMPVTLNDINKAGFEPHRPPYSAESVAISIFSSALPFQLHFSS